MTDLDPRIRFALATLGRRVRRIERETRSQARAAQARFRSVEEGGNVTFYDIDGQPRVIVGGQEDGTHTIVELGGDAPPVPSAPIVASLPGALAITFDGFTEDDERNWPNDFARVEVHVSALEGAPAEDETEVHAFTSPRGGSITIPVNPDQAWYVTLVSVSRGGVESAQSVEVEAIADPLDQVKFHEDEFTLAAGGAEALELTHTPLEHSEHVYWHPDGLAGIYQREGVTWSRDPDTATVQLAAAAVEAKPGDRVTVEYAYRPSRWVKPPDPTEFTVAAWTTLDGAGSIPLPPAVQVGDLAVVAITGAVAVTDPRLTRVATANVSSAGGPGVAEVWVGQMTALGDLAAANNAGGSGGASGVVAWLRGVDRPLNHDGRVVIEGPRQGGTGALPGLPGAASGTVLAAFGISGMYGSAVGGSTIGPWPAYIDETLQTNGYWVSGIGVDHAHTGPAADGVLVGDPQDGWFAVLLGVD